MLKNTEDNFNVISSKIQEKITNYSKKYSINEAVNFEEEQEEENVVKEEPITETSDNVKQIRKICLNSINELSDDVDSEEYDCFKKIFDICDNLLRRKFNKK